MKKIYLPVKPATTANTSAAKTIAPLANTDTATTNEQNSNNSETIEGEEKGTEEEGPKYLHQALGISDERNVEIKSLSLSAVDKMKSNGVKMNEQNLLKALSVIEMTQLESVYAGFVTSEIFRAMEQENNPIAMLAKMLGIE